MLSRRDPGKRGARYVRRARFSLRTSTIPNSCLIVTSYLLSYGGNHCLLNFSKDVRATFCLTNRGHAHQHLCDEDSCARDMRLVSHKSPRHLCIPPVDKKLRSLLYVSHIPHNAFEKVTIIPTSILRSASLDVDTSCLFPNVSFKVQHALAIVSYRTPAELLPCSAAQNLLENSGDHVKLQVKCMDAPDVVHVVTAPTKPSYFTNNHVARTPGLNLGLAYKRGFSQQAR